MSTTSKGFPYPAATDAPDGPGAFYALATFLNNTTSNWSPNLGGGSGEALGTGSSVIGHAFNLAGQVILTGRLAFGGGTISFGTNPTITGSPINVEQATASGRATLTRGGSWIAGFDLVATSPSQFSVVGAGALSPQQSDTLIFRIFGYAA